MTPAERLRAAAVKLRAVAVENRAAPGEPGVAPGPWERVPSEGKHGHLVASPAWSPVALAEFRDDAELIAVVASPDRVRLVADLLDALAPLADDAATVGTLPTVPFVGAALALADAYLAA